MILLYVDPRKLNSVAFKPPTEAAIHHPDAVAFSVAGFHRFDDVFHGGDVRRVAGKDFITQRHSASRHHQSDAHLPAVAAVVSRIAALSQRVAFRLTFEVSACDIVHQQVVFEIEQIAKPILQMRFQSVLVRQQLIERAVQPIVVHTFFAHAKQVGPRRFRIPLFGGEQFAGGFEQPGNDQNQRTHIPADQLATFGNRVAQKSVELQRTNQVQSDPRSARLPQVFNTNSGGVDFNPARSDSGRIVIEFKSHLPTERLRSIGGRCG